MAVLRTEICSNSKFALSDEPLIRRKNGDAQSRRQPIEFAAPPHVVLIHRTASLCLDMRNTTILLYYAHR